MHGTHLYASNSYANDSLVMTLNRINNQKQSGVFEESSLLTVYALSKNRKQILIFLHS